MAGITQFLKSIHPQIVRLRGLNRAKAVIVTGNESADLDSCASSVLAAYFYSKDSKRQNFSSVESVIPLINIPRDDFSTRPDVVYLFQQLGISSDHLFFQEDLEDLVQNSKVSLTAFLVDHNNLVGRHRASDVFSAVEGVIDHHEDENLYKTNDTQPRIIEKCGSCSSLVINYFRSRLDDDSVFSDDGVVRLGIAPLLIDTSNMTHKVEQLDIDSVNFLKSKITAGSSFHFDTVTLYNTLKDRKEDLDVLSLSDIFKKDYKQWEAGKFNLGISSVPKPLSYLLKRDDFDSTVKRFAENKSLDVYAIMTSFRGSDGEGHFRELALYSSNGQAKEGVRQFLSSCGSNLQLEAQTGKTITGVLETFDQRNAEASRKQVAPLLRKSLGS